MARFSGALDKWCAGGETPFNNGNYVHRFGRPGAPTLVCKFCSRKVTRDANGNIRRHAWEPVNESTKPGANTQATRAARAFERTRDRRA